MADQTIPDLPLISAVTDGVQLPVDDSLQTYRATAAQVKSYILANEAILLAMLKQDIFTGLTAVTPADDDYFPLVDTSDSNKTKKGLVGSFMRRLYRGITSTDSLGVNDGLAKLSGASFTLTLPTAIGVEGKEYEIQHAGTSLTQVYTLATTSGQTIGGVASGSYSLYTNGETLRVRSDGANWLVVAHFTNTPTTDYGNVSSLITAVTTNPTFGTITRNKVYGRRFGEYMEFDYQFAQSTNGTAGSGDYLYALPSGFTFDTTTYPTTTAALGTSNSYAWLPSFYGRFYHSSGPTSNGLAGILPYSSTQFRIQVLSAASSSTFHSSANGQFSGTLSLGFSFRAKIANWQP